MTKISNLGLLGQQEHIFQIEPLKATKQKQQFINWGGNRYKDEILLQQQQLSWESFELQYIRTTLQSMMPGFGIAMLTESPGLFKQCPTMMILKFHCGLG